MTPLRFCWALLCGLLFSTGSLPAELPPPPVLQAKWTPSAHQGAVPRFEIQGTEDRNNPLRIPLGQPFAGEELYVRFRLNYAQESLDTPPDDEGEFLVLWLDETEGSDLSPHSNGVPNVGVHVTNSENRFMARFTSQQQSFTPIQLKGDQDYLIV